MLLYHLSTAEIYKLFCFKEPKTSTSLSGPTQKSSKRTPSFSAGVKLESGEWIGGDVVICFDGIKSGIRRQMAAAHGVKDHTRSTGDAAYRFIVPKEKNEIRQARFGIP